MLDTITPRSGFGSKSLLSILGVIAFIGTLLGIVSIVAPTLISLPKVLVSVTQTFNVTFAPEHIWNFKALSIGRVDAGVEINGTVILFTWSSPDQPYVFYVASQSDYNNFDPSHQRPYTYMVGPDNCTDYSFSMHAFIYKISFTAKETTTYYILADAYRTTNMRADLAFKSYASDPTWVEIQYWGTLISGLVAILVFLFGWRRFP